MNYQVLWLLFGRLLGVHESYISANAVLLQECRGMRYMTDLVMAALFSMHICRLQHI
jgi:hypothetical protein